MTSKVNVLSAQTQPGSGNIMNVDSLAVPGGTLYITSIMNGNTVASASATFVPTAALVRYLRLLSAVADTGVGLTATATSGACGISRTTGTSLALVGEATSASAKTDKAAFDIILPDTYVAGTDIPVTINAVVTGAGVLTAASTTMTLNAYTETNGVEAALTVTAAVQIPATTKADLAFTISGNGLVPGQHLVLECVMLVTSASGANTGAINSVSYKA